MVVGTQALEASLISRKPGQEQRSWDWKQALRVGMWHQLSTWDVLGSNSQAAQVPPSGVSCPRSSGLSGQEAEAESTWTLRKRRRGRRLDRTRPSVQVKHHGALSAISAPPRKAGILAPRPVRPCSRMWKLRLGIRQILGDHVWEPSAPREDRAAGLGSFTATWPQAGRTSGRLSGTSTWLGCLALPKTQEEPQFDSIGHPDPGVPIRGGSPHGHLSSPSEPCLFQICRGRGLGAPGPPPVQPCLPGTASS